MHIEKIENSGQARLFNSRYLEIFTKAHPLLIWGMYLPLILYMLYYSHASLDYSILKVFLLFIGGVFFWTFFEYIAHRCILDPSKKKREAFSPPLLFVTN